MPALAPNDSLPANGRPGNPKVSVVIPVMNERRTIAAVIRQAKRVHDDTEVIVVANGTTDGSDAVAERMGAKVIRFAAPLGHDVGRSIGMKAARGDIILFTDADIVIPAGKLREFVRAVENGADVALNSYLGPVHKRRVHSVVLSKHALAAFLGSFAMKGVSLTTIPHAFSRQALDAIGASHLAVPPKALAIAAVRGLTVRPVSYVEVGVNNPHKKRGKRNDPLEKLIVGDHLEAIHWLVAARSTRGGFTDLDRKRDMVR